MTSSMLADICDLDELKSGVRQEGMYGAVFAWVFKLGISGVMILSGYMMNWSGFDQSVAVQSVSTIFSLRILYALVPAVGMIIAISTMAFYSITKARALEIRKELDIRKSLQTA
ncbi:MAG: MFS transporter [Phycisphaerales bacterium]